MYLVDYLARDNPLVGREVAHVGIFNRSAVLRQEAWIASRALIALVAGEARDARLSSEVLLVDRVHHHDHLARALHPRGLFGERGLVEVGLRHVAERAVVPHRVGKHTHRVEEGVYGNAAQQHDLLEHLFRHRPPVRRTLRGSGGGCGLAGFHCDAEQANHGKRNGAEKQSPRSNNHVVASSVDMRAVSGAYRRSTPNAQHPTPKNFSQHWH